MDEPGEKEQDNTEEETILDGMTLAEFASLNDNLLTTETLEDDWEENLQAKARGEIPAEEDEEDEEEPEPVKTITTKEFSEQLLGMRDYALRLDNAEMLDLLNKTQALLESQKLTQTSKLKQASIKGFFKLWKSLECGLKTALFRANTLYKKIKFMLY